MTSTHAKITDKLIAEEQTTTDLGNKSWYEHCEELEEGEMLDDSIVITDADLKAEPSPKKSPEIKSPVKDDKHSTSADREILVSFLDSTNEEKYERLLQEEKIKPTFKRRLSLNSSAISHGSGEKRDSEQSSPRSSDHSPSTYGKRAREVETDEAILDRRQKQIDYGKNTIGYDYYSKQVPRENRTKDHPWTPRKDLKYSRRAFDGLVKVWRKKLHCFDPVNRKQNTQQSKSDDSEDASGQGI